MGTSAKRALTALLTRARHFRSPGIAAPSRLTLEPPCMAGVNRKCMQSPGPVIADTNAHDDKQRARAHSMQREARAH
eukprot:3671041-Alexandrium_andersonii.AAC.1